MGPLYVFSCPGREWHKGFELLGCESAFRVSQCRVGAWSGHLGLTPTIPARKSNRRCGYDLQEHPPGHRVGWTRSAKRDPGFWTPIQTLSLPFLRFFPVSICKFPGLVSDAYCRLIAAILVLRLHMKLLRCCWANNTGFSND